MSIHSLKSLKINEGLFRDVLDFTEEHCKTINNKLYETILKELRVAEPDEDGYYLLSQDARDWVVSTIESMFAS